MDGPEDLRIPRRNMGVGMWGEEALYPDRCISREREEAV